MPSSEHTDRSTQKAPSTKSLALMLALIFVAVTIYQFIYWASFGWTWLITQNFASNSMFYESQFVGIAAFVILYIVVAIIVRGVPSRKVSIKPTFMYIFPFFMAAYFAYFAGTLIFSLFDLYFLPLSSTFSYTLGPLLFFSPVSPSVVLTVVSMGALYSRLSISSKNTSMVWTNGFTRYWLDIRH